MTLEQVATRLNMTPAQLERKLRLVESELFTLAHRYGVRTVAELDQAVQAGRFHEPEAFDDYFRFDYLEDQRHVLLDMMP
jgi:hypothetical protein